jgi:hypothetical protein
MVTKQLKDLRRHRSGISVGRLRNLHCLGLANEPNDKFACEGAPEWPRYRSKNDQIMELGSTAQVRKNFRKAQLDAHEAAMRNDLAAQPQVLDQLLRDGF